MELEGLGCVIIGERPRVYTVAKFYADIGKCVLLPRNFNFKNGKLSILSYDKHDPRPLNARPWLVSLASSCSFFDLKALQDAEIEKMDKELME